jgi:hypothetical protein
MMPKIDPLASCVTSRKFGGQRLDALALGTLGSG